MTPQRSTDYTSAPCWRGFIVLLVLTLMIFSCAKKDLISVPAVLAPHLYPEIMPPASYHRGMWVRAVSIASADSLARIMSIAQEMNITDLYVQTVVGGYAYHRSDILPRSQYLAELSPPGYDPLDSLIQLASAESLRVHAWVNALLVWSLKDPPDSARHVYYTHPEWFIKDVTGRSMRDYTFEQWLESGLEGLYLDPGHPDVQQHIQDICTEITFHYPVAGIHLDFIRYPGTLWGIQETDTAYLMTGLEGYQVRWLNLMRYPQMTFLQRWMAWHNWKHYLNKKQRIDAIVGKTWNAINQNPYIPHISLTTAVFADAGMGQYRFCQDWRSWHMIAYPIIMSYYEDLGSFGTALTSIQQIAPNAVFGIGLLWENIDTVAFMQSACVEKTRGRGICYFDFTNLDTLVNRSVLMSSTMAFYPSLPVHDTTLQPIQGAFSSLPPSRLASVKLPSFDHADSSFVEFLFSLSMDPDNDIQRMNLSRGDFIQHVLDDVSAFNRLDTALFPMPDTLVQPPARTIRYEFYPWDGLDSLAVLSKARRITTYSQTVTLVPNALDPLSRAAFALDVHDRTTIKTRAGVYAVEVVTETAGGGKILRFGTPPDRVPFCVSWTLLERARRLLNDY